MDKKVVVTEIVESVLKEKKFTRDSDELLYYQVCLKFNPSIKEMKVKDFFTNRSYMGVPTYETVRRTRAKLQKSNENLRGLNSIQDKITGKKKRYLKYSSI